jgi:signal transduction histidine kinase
MGGLSIAARAESSFPWRPSLAVGAFAVAFLAVVSLPWIDESHRLAVAIWSPSFLLFALILYMVRMLRTVPLRRDRRRAWTTLAIGLAINLAATVAWAWMATFRRGVEVPLDNNLLYMATYPPVVVIAAIFFLRDAGGSLIRPGALLDAAALSIGAAAALYGLIILPIYGQTTEVSTLAQAFWLGFSVLLPGVLAGILFTHVVDWSADRSLALLLLAGIANIVGDLLWSVRTVPERLDETVSFSLVYLLATATCFTSVALEARQRVVPAKTHAPSHSMLPTVVALGGAIGLVRAMQPGGAGQGLVPSLIAAVGVILLVREWIARREQLRVHRLRHARLEAFETERRDRTALSGQLHEGLAQELTGVHRALSSTVGDPARQRPVVEQAIEQLGHTLNRARDMASRIAPMEPKQGDLRSALKGLVARANHATCHWELECAPLPLDLPAEVTDCIWRLVEHLLQAVGGEPAVRSIRLRVRVTNVRLVLEVDLASSQPLPEDWRTGDVPKVLCGYAVRVGGLGDVQHSSATWRFRGLLPRIPGTLGV